MYGGLARQPRIAWSAFRRPLWVVLAAAHIPALVTALTSFINSGFEAEWLGGCVALTATMLFFVLKFVDVRALRLRSDRRSLVAMCVIVLLLHTGALDARIDATMAPQCLTVVMTTLLLAGLARVSGVLAATFRRATATVKLGSLLRQSNETAWSDPFRPHCWVLAYRFFTLRAPPA